MSIANAWFMAVLALLLFWAVGAYSRLQGLRTAILSAFAHLDTHVRRRHDIAQRTVASLRPQLPSAHDTLERLLAASSQVVAATDLVKGHVHQSGPIQSCSMAEDVFQNSHARLHAVLDEQDPAVSSPELSSLLEELQLADNQARFSRNLYNQAAQTYNEAATLWPTRLVARLCGFGRAATLHPAPSRIEAPRVRSEAGATP
jgi:LemA protein